MAMGQMPVMPAAPAVPAAPAQEASATPAADSSADANANYIEIKVAYYRNFLP